MTFHSERAMRSHVFTSIDGSLYAYASVVLVVQ